MNIYVVIEGEKGSVEVYKNWIKYLNPKLLYVPHIYQLKENNFFIKAGYGYPGIKDIIRKSIEEVNNIKTVDRFVVAVDSEDSSFDDKYKEFHDFLNGFRLNAEFHIIIQHFCLETWALGNRKVAPHFPKSEELKNYKRIFDVLNEDPELLPPLDLINLKLNRSSFAFKYLVKMLNDKFRNISYSKSNTEMISHSQYFKEIRKRCLDTNHIQSFNYFINAFSEKEV